MAEMKYQELFTVIMGRELDFECAKDKVVATNLSIFFADRDDYVVYNGNRVVNRDFYMSLTNSKKRLFSTTDAKIAEFLRKTIASRRYSSEQKDALVGYMAVARKMAHRTDEQHLIYEIRTMYENNLNCKPDETTATLITDAVRVSMEIGKTYFGVMPRMK